MCLYAPDVVRGADGRYYLYYVLDKVPVVSVAVCDTRQEDMSFMDMSGIRTGGVWESGRVTSRSSTPEF